MKNITFSADENLIKKARLKAAKENSSLNQRFREWLYRYAGETEYEKEFEELMDKLSYAKPGRKFTREEMNER